jgi:peptide methionine sulfoxide reductase MsrB
VAWSSSSDSSRRAFFQSSAAALFVGAAPANAVGVRYGDESIMAQKEHGTSAAPVQSNLLYGVDNQLADRICNYNRHFAELGGYFQKTTFEDTVLNAQGPITFYDSVTGKPLFVAPKNRSAEEFVKESRKHGWPSFRDDEVVWENVRVLKNSGETVSLDGTHLGHNLPDSKGNRYCINLVSIAGKPTGSV